MNPTLTLKTGRRDAIRVIHKTMPLRAVGAATAVVLDYVQDLFEVEELVILTKACEVSSQCLPLRVVEGVELAVITYLEGR